MFVAFFVPVILAFICLRVASTSVFVPFLVNSAPAGAARLRRAHPVGPIAERSKALVPTDAGRASIGAELQDAVVVARVAGEACPCLLRSASASSAARTVL